MAFESLTLSTPPESQKPLGEDLLSEWKLLWPQGRISHTDFSNYLGDFLIQNRGGEKLQQNEGQVGEGSAFAGKDEQRPREKEMGGLISVPFKSPAVKLIPPAVVAQTTKHCLQCRKPGFDPWVGKIPWRREWLRPPGFLSGEFHRQSSLVGNSPWGHTDSDTTERLSLAYLKHSDKPGGGSEANK